MHIRPATPDDVELLFDIRTSVLENHQSRAELASIGVTPRTVEEMLRTTARAWVAEVEGRAMGFSMADGAEGTVFAMFVRPGWEGRGAGRALMREAEAWLFAEGWDEIWLLTSRDPALRANGFYRRLGWTQAEWGADGQVKYVKVKPGT
jgi:GNAT superfamily N-acetyltransferase